MKFERVISPTFNIEPQPEPFDASKYTDDEEMLAAFEEHVRHPPAKTQELKAYDIPVAKIIEDNSVKDIMDEEDEFILSTILGKK